MSRVCARAFRSIVSRPFTRSDSIPDAAAQDLRPSQNRVQRCTELVRERREEFVLHIAHPLGHTSRGSLALEECLPLFRRLLRRFVEAGVVNGDACLSGNADDQSFGPFGKNARLGVSEKQPADDLTRA